jgi:hypothetical protein
MRSISATRVTPGKSAVVRRACPIVSAYGFAIRDSVVRHILATPSVFWAALGIMPGTARMVAVCTALRPGHWQTPAIQGD